MQIYFFTRTNRSRNIAQKIAEQLGIEANEIKDGINWKGFFNFFKAGRMAIKKVTVPIKHNDVNEKGQVIIVFPVWAGTFPPAIRSFLNKIGRSRVVLVPTSNGSKIKERNGFSQIVDLVGKDIEVPKLNIVE